MREGAMLGMYTVDKSSGSTICSNNGQNKSKVLLSVMNSKFWHISQAVRWYDTCSASAQLRAPAFIRSQHKAVIYVGILHDHKGGEVEREKVEHYRKIPLSPELRRALYAHCSFVLIHFALSIALHPASIPRYWIPKRAVGATKALASRTNSTECKQAGSLKAFSSKSADQFALLSIASHSPVSTTPILRKSVKCPPFTSTSLGQSKT